MKHKIKVEIHQEPELRRKDSFWFAGHVATITNGKKTVNVCAIGHVQVCFNPNESNFYNHDARKEARSRGYTDVKLKNISNHDGWGNNNWFAFEVIKDGKTTWDDHTDIKFDDAIGYAKDLVTNTD